MPVLSNRWPSVNCCCSPKAWNRIVADEQASFKTAAMANKKTRVTSPAKTPKKSVVSNIATQKLGSDIVKLPPVFSKDSKYVDVPI